MLEGFERHAATTGQENPLDAMRKQNDEIKANLGNLQTKELQKRIHQLQQKNMKEEAELGRTEAELLARKRFYEENAPPQVQHQIPAIFRGLNGNPPAAEEPRIQEIHDEE